MSLNTLKKVLSMIGCLFFLCSLIFPFLFVSRPASQFMVDWDNTYFWSFKSSTHQIRSFFLNQTLEYWFYDYWVRESAFRSDLLVVFSLMFVVQILTLLAETASILINRRVLPLVPAILCPIVTALMVHVGTSYEFSISYQLGYWLTYPSMFLFIIAFMLTLVTSKKQTTS